MLLVVRLCSADAAILCTRALSHEKFSGRQTQARGVGLFRMAGACVLSSRLWRGVGLVVLQDRGFRG